MKFRGEGELIPRVVTSISPSGLEVKLNQLSEEGFDYVDLQYSSTTLSLGDIEYSALALLKKREG